MQLPKSSYSFYCSFGLTESCKYNFRIIPVLTVTALLLLKFWILCLTWKIKFLWEALHFPIINPLAHYFEGTLLRRVCFMIGYDPLQKLLELWQRVLLCYCTWDKVIKSLGRWIFFFFLIHEQRTFMLSLWYCILHSCF